MDVSVIIPVYNCEKWIAECLDSVINQNSVREIIAVDDGSIDNSYALLQSYAKKDPRIKILTHKEHKNCGRSKSRNLGILNASSSWIAFLDADDYFLANRFDSFSFKENLDGYYGAIKTIYESKDLISLFPEKRTSLSRIVDSRDLLDYLIINPEEGFSINSLTIKKSCLNQIGGFDESLSIGEDTDLIWRLAAHFRLTHCEFIEPLAIRRIHGKNSFSNKKDVQEGRYHFYRKWLNQKEINLSTNAVKRIINGYVYYHPLRLSFAPFRLILKKYLLFKYQGIKALQ